MICLSINQRTPELLYLGVTVILELGFHAVSSPSENPGLSIFSYRRGICHAFREEPNHNEEEDPIEYSSSAIRPSRYHSASWNDTKGAKLLINDSNPNQRGIFGSNDVDRT